MLKYEYYVVQAGIAVFGFGDTPSEAVAMANEFSDHKLRVSEIAQYVGTAKSSDRMCDKSMTQFGELHHGEMVLLDRDTAQSVGYKDVD
ncbi:hypothetical protein APY04_0810 [Hyphomicrobium sulfonivorans]|uniref:Uncharacterized protein n=1 Tax=Hyphomicrobium sulfonivorans TaxID=121290 RepID=A0A109BL51_HYPSL|nr:hypothetical protein [Hyphomicrobium sulfonivorans]KWT70749.1 hypothetical protein APY04_0810 [Hyphomicrobium sulfonivorans]